MLSLPRVPGANLGNALAARLRPFLRVKAAYRETFDCTAGQMVLRDIARRGGMFETSQVDGATDRTAFNEGRRALALEIFGMLRWSDGEMAQLVTQRDPDALAAYAEAEG